MIDNKMFPWGDNEDVKLVFDLIREFSPELEELIKVVLSAEAIESSGGAGGKKTYAQRLHIALSVMEKERSAGAGWVALQEKRPRSYIATFGSLKLGLESKIIAESMGISESGVRSHVSGGKSFLRDFDTGEFDGIGLA